MAPDYDPFDTLKRAALADAPEGEIGMVVFHPGYLDAYLMKTSSLLKPRVLEVETACAQETKEWLLAHEVELISYDDIPY